MSDTEVLQAPPLERGTMVIPRYEVLDHVARTGWLDLYDAWSQERECRCVVKVVRPDLRDERRPADRLVQEGRWLQSFTHPHLVRAYETGTWPQPYVVQETLTGETLSHLVHRLRRRMAATDLAFLGLHLCSALHYLHGQGLLHLDIKPSNVVVDCRRAKVLDLSIARPPGPIPAGVGTFSYLAPEQARGTTVTAAADVWGIGVTLYEVATGDLPFDPGETCDSEYADSEEPGENKGTGTAGTGGTGDWYPQLEERAPSVRSRRNLPPKLAAAIDSCLEPDPGARPTIPQLAATLDTLLTQGRRDVPPPPPPVD